MFFQCTLQRVEAGIASMSTMLMTPLDTFYDKANLTQGKAEHDAV